MSNKKKKTIKDMSPDWWTEHMSNPLPPPRTESNQSDTDQLEPPTMEELADAVKELGDINCVGVMVADLLNAIEKLQIDPNATEKQKQILRRLRPLIFAANFFMRQAGMIAYDAGIHPIQDDDQKTS